MKNLLISLVMMIAMCAGCITTSQEYVIPDAMYKNGNLLESKIMDITKGNPKFLGTLTKGAVIAKVTKHPQSLPEVKRVLGIIKTMVDAEGTTYDSMFAYTVSQINRLESQYTIGLLFLLQDFSSLKLDATFLLEGDKVLLRKNISEMEEFFELIEE